MRRIPIPRGEGMAVCRRAALSLGGNQVRGTPRGGRRGRQKNVGPVSKTVHMREGYTIYLLLNTCETVAVFRLPSRLQACAGEERGKGCWCNDRSGSPVLCNHRALINTVVGRQTVTPGVSVSHVFTVASGFRPHHHQQPQDRLHRARVCCAVNRYMDMVHTEIGSVSRGQAREAGRESVREREGFSHWAVCYCMSRDGTTASSWRCRSGLARPYKILPTLC